MFDTTHLHPMIVHFPIALLIIGFLFDIMSLIFKKDFFNKAGFYLLLLGTLGVIASYITGNLAGDGVTEAGALKQAIDTHEDAAILTMWIVIGIAFIRIFLVAVRKYKGVFKLAAVILFLLGVLSVARTGYYGGELVYKHAAGVQMNLGSELDQNNYGSKENEKKVED